MVNGKTLRPPAGASLADMIRLMDAAVVSKKFAYSEVLLQFLVNTFLPAANAEGINGRLYSSWDILKGDATQLPETLPSQLTAPLYIVLSPALLADYLATQAEAALAKSCDKQMSELKALLEQQKMGVSELNCGEDPRGADRSIGFWIKGPDGKPMKREFDFNYRLAMMQERNKEEKDDKDDDDEHKVQPIVLYRFGLLGNNNLVEVRTLQMNEAGNLRRIDYKPSQPEFAKYRESITPISKIMTYIGQNRTCDKCYNQIASEIVALRPPRFLIPPKPVPMPTNPGEGPTSGPAVAMSGPGLSGGQPAVVQPNATLTRDEDDVETEK